MNPSPYTRERDVALAAAGAAAAFIRSRAGQVEASAIRDKGVHDPVTFVDEEAQRIIAEHLLAAFPGDVMLGEEGTEGEVEAAPEGRRWIVDPLDGTTNFTRGIPPWAVSIALQEGPNLAVAVVLDGSYDERFVAVRGEGLTVNGRPARVAETDALDAALLATGYPFRDYRYVDGYLETFERLIRATRGVRRHGSAAMDLAWVACGRFDGFFEGGLAPWDVAAGVLLVREGGGCVTGLSAGDDPVFSGGLVASNGRLHTALAEACGPLAHAYAARESVAP